MIIDKQGKLFGKISVIDLALIILILAAGVFIGLKFLGASSDGSRNMECTYVVKVEKIKESSLEYFVVGDTLFDDEGAYMGEIVKEPEVANATDVVNKSDGEYVSAEIPGRVDVLVTIRGQGIQNSNGFYLDGKVSLLLGTDRYFKGDDIDFTGSVVEILE